MCLWRRWTNRKCFHFCSVLHINEASVDSSVYFRFFFGVYRKQASSKVVQCPAWGIHAWILMDEGSISRVTHPSWEFSLLTLWLLQALWRHISAGMMALFLLLPAHLYQSSVTLEILLRSVNDGSTRTCRHKSPHIIVLLRLLAHPPEILLSIFFPDAYAATQYFNVAVNHSDPDKFLWVFSSVVSGEFLHSWQFGKYPNDGSVK